MLDSMKQYQITPEGRDFFEELDRTIDKTQTSPNMETLRYCLLEVLLVENLVLPDPGDEYEHRIVRGLDLLEKEGLVESIGLLSNA